MAAQNNGNQNVSNVDFVPVMLKPPSGFQLIPVYEPFGVIVTRANEWLTQNPAVEVVSCESAECRAEENGVLNNDNGNYVESGRFRTCYVRFLRIWLRERTSSDPAGPTQISYMNVVPACTSQGGLFSLPTFETFGQTIGHINEILKNDPLPGKIVNVETLDTKFAKWEGGVNADTTFWIKSSKVATIFLSIIRVFYKKGPPQNELIGSVAFLPKQMGTIKMFFQQLPVYEPFSSVVNSANEWLASESPINMINMQSLDFKLDFRNGGLDCERMCFWESSKHSSFYVRYLRLIYLTGGSAQPPSQNIQASYRTFEPIQLSAGSNYVMGRYETIGQTLARAQAWIAVTGARVIAVETVTANVSPGRAVGSDMYAPSERIMNLNSAKFSTYFINCLRFYFDGPVEEPAPELLPPVPVFDPRPPPSPSCALL